MKVKTSELTGAALNWAAAKCEVIVIGRLYGNGDYSSNWFYGRPIIEREKIMVEPFDPVWRAAIWDYEIGFCCFYRGKTPLEAAMRCYVGSKLGEEVEIPDELFPLTTPKESGK